jgi:hypothetical protein
VTTPMKVTIVRPDGSAVDFIAGAVSLVFRAWLAMLCLGGLFPDLGISYGQALLGLIVVGAINPSDYIFWTKSPGWKP